MFYTVYVLLSLVLFHIAPKYKDNMLLMAGETKDYGKRKSLLRGNNPWVKRLSKSVTNGYAGHFD
jgi:hypothetical protein